MKTTPRWILTVLLAILLASLPILVGSKPQANVSAQDGVENDEPVKIEGFYQEPQAEQPKAIINATLTVGNSCSYSSIAGAIAVAGDGDLILVEGGRTFNENTLLVVEKNLTIEGGYPGCASASSDPTTIDANNLSFVIEVKGANVNLTNLIITNGLAGNGGGIRALGSVSVGSNVTLDNTKVFQNQASNGGGIYISADSTVTLTNNSDITYNLGTSNGGGARVWGKLIAHDWNSGISNNQAPNGGGLSVPGGEVDFSGSHLADNSAVGFGGAIHVYDQGLVKIGGSSNIMRNSATSGAGIFADNANVDSTNAVIHGNTASSAGGGIFLAENSVLTASNTYIGYVFTNPNSGRNTAAVGAGLYVDIAATATFSGEIVNNHATSHGGGLYKSSTSGTVNISNALIKGNTSGANGGAALVDGGSLNLDGPLTIENNTAALNGGAVAVQNSGVVSISASNGMIEVLGNQAQNNGGAFHTQNNNTFKLYATSSYPLEIHDNSAAVLGGAVHASSNGFYDVYGQVLFHTNSAASGGAVYLSGGSRIWFDDYVTIAPQIYNNTAYNGGAIYADASPSVRFDGAMVGSELGGNHATAGHGGAIYLYNSTLNAQNTQFINNVAADHGGAIYASNNSSLTIDANLNSPGMNTFTERHDETLDGSSIQASACNPLTRECSALAGNIADSNLDNIGLGGAIYLNESLMTMSQTYLHDNVAYYGGAIFQTGTSSASTISNSLIHHNTVTLALGAGIRRSGGSFTLSHVTITDNSGGSGFSGEATSASNSIAWENLYPGFSTAPMSYACNIDNGAHAGPSMDPLFVNPGVGRNYHLQSGSPAVDACLTGAPVDLENYARPIGAGYNMGAFEKIGYPVYLPIILR